MQFELNANSFSMLSLPPSARALFVCPFTGKVKKDELVARLAIVQKDCDEFFTSLGHWGSGTDPLGRASQAGKRQLVLLRAKLQSVCETVAKASDPVGPSRGGPASGDVGRGRGRGRGPETKASPKRPADPALAAQLAQLTSMVQRQGEELKKQDRVR